jgi:hypothetical protein
MKPARKLWLGPFALRHRSHTLGQRWPRCGETALYTEVWYRRQQARLFL